MNSNFEKEIREIFLDDIIPNRFQPRLNFDEKSLMELSDSIKQHGIIQPLVLRKLGDKYEIIAGERRYKASQIAGLTKVPAIITDLDDNSSAEVAIVENLHRKEMSALEEAKSFKKLLERGITQEQLGIRLGKSQSYIANKLRLLSLNETVQEALILEKISERHARSLLSVKDLSEQQRLLEEIINRKLTVKETDDIIKERFGTLLVEEPVQQIEEKKSMNIMDFNLEDIKLEPEVKEHITPEPLINESIVQSQNINMGPHLEVFNEEPEVNIPKPFILIDEEVTEESSIPEPHKNVEINPQMNLINKLNSVDVNAEELSFRETNSVNSSPYVTPKIDIEDAYIKPQNIFDVDNLKTNAKNINEEQQKSFDISQLLVSDTKEENNVVQPQMPEQNIINPNKFIMNIDEQPKKEINRDIENSKNMIKAVVETIHNSGVKIDYEEFDFERLYQIIIKLEK